MTQTVFFANRLSHIPNEILLTIMANMPDLPTLHNFITAYRLSEDLYGASYNRVLTGTIRQIESLQLQKLVCTVISLRNHTCLTDVEDLDKYLDMHLEDENVPLMIDDISDPMSALHDIVLVSQDIEFFVNSFVTSRLREPGTHCCFIHKENPPSQTEIQRIRRGFWRLQVLCELFKFKVKGAVNPNHEVPPDCTFAEHLANWELEEMECTYYHLHEQYDILRLPTHNALLLSQPQIVQRMLLNLGYRKGDPSPKRLDSDLMGPEKDDRITHAFSWARDFFWRPPLHTAWSDMPSANVPNAGWLMYVRYGNRWEKLSVPVHDEIAREPVICFQNWGYCMWDESRIVGWGLLEMGKYSLLDTQKWEDKEKTRRSCTQCPYARRSVSEISSNASDRLTSIYWE